VSDPRSIVFGLESLFWHISLKFALLREEFVVNEYMCEALDAKDERAALKLMEEMSKSLGVSGRLYGILHESNTTQVIARQLNNATAPTISPRIWL
jgi:hypothetical protein